jgi:hypothetical protein
MEIYEPYYSAERLLRSGLLAQFQCALITLSRVLKTEKNFKNRVCSLMIGRSFCGFAVCLTNLGCSG